jgi:hypothetical protein
MKVSFQKKRTRHTPCPLYNIEQLYFTQLLFLLFYLQQQEPVQHQLL